MYIHSDLRTMAQTAQLRLNSLLGFLQPKADGHGSSGLTRNWPRLDWRYIQLQQAASASSGKQGKKGSDLPARAVLLSRIGGSEPIGAVERVGRGPEEAWIGRPWERLDE